ncbi:Uncharacterized protein dnm_006010 [Desulfonema magnum]|uniref:Uncharacterized protein n=1 Tax=Desulfonema magnum TaxID=45655 RepID=A0A975BFR4_9BACT|nr:Uncharacterized protein dnm_006010 [Desulfonema magnum]
MERSGTHRTRWVPLRSTHPTFGGIFVALKERFWNGKIFFMKKCPQESFLDINNYNR